MFPFDVIRNMSKRWWNKKKKREKLVNEKTKSKENWQIECKVNGLKAVSNSGLAYIIQEGKSVADMLHLLTKTDFSGWSLKGGFTPPKMLCKA